MWRALLMLLCLTSPDRAEAPAAVRAEGLRVELRLSAGPGIVAALRFHMEPGWHLYWQNPGDSGLAPEVAWELPEGWTAGPLQHPVPLALPSPEGLDYVHPGAFTLLAKLAPPPGTPPTGTVRARVDWLACKEVCVRGHAVLAARVGNPGTRLNPADLRVARARLPQPQSPQLQTGPPALRRVGDRWLIQVPLQGPAAAKAEAFFPEPLPGFTIVHREVRCAGSLLQVPILPSALGSKLVALRGVLVSGGQGFVLELPLPGAPAP